MIRFRHIGLTITLIYGISISEAQSKPEIYLIPDEAKCVVRQTDKLTFCTDMDGKPITGELRRYQGETLVRSYAFKDGLREGATITYGANRLPKSEKQYKKGVLSGFVREYYDNGSLKSEMPYVNGVKEGIAKNYAEDGTMRSQMIYEKDTLNGEMRLYTPEGKTLYSFKNEENRLVSGSYYFRRANGMIDMIDIPQIALAALNYACAELQTELTDSGCAVTYKGTRNTCDESWYKTNRKDFLQYLSECAKGVKDEQY